MSRKRKTKYVPLEKIVEAHPNLAKPGTFRPKTSRANIENRIKRARAHLAMLEMVKLGRIPDGPYNQAEFQKYLAPFFCDWPW